jgi:hypothetical protein
MPRVATAVVLALITWTGLFAQQPADLNLTVSVQGADGRVVPVAGHRLLVSDSPATALPRTVVTATDGTAALRLPPGKYIVESDRPFVLNGRRYEWTVLVDLAAGREAPLVLSADNASIGVATERDQTSPIPGATLDRSASVLTAWQDSTFALWAPRAHASGFLADGAGLVATSLRALDGATNVAVQISRILKVSGVVVAADPSADVAVVRVHPSTVAGLRPVPMACDTPATPDAVEESIAIDVSLTGARGVTSRAFLTPSSVGGPVFGDDSRAIGLVSPPVGTETDMRVTSAGAVCAAVVRARVAEATTPDPAALPIEPARPLPIAEIKAIAARAPAAPTAYRVSSSDFDVTFLTPVLMASVQARQGWTSGSTAEEWSGGRVATEFEQWTDYVATNPPVIFVRVSPRLVEGFWMKVARGAASTQGAQIPPIKRLRPGFSAMRLRCGQRDVIPIHPFRIQTRVSDTEAIEEGFYAFDPDAVGPHCGSVSLVLSSVKDPGKAETVTVAPSIIRRVWDDWAWYRASRN